MTTPKPNGKRSRNPATLERLNDDPNAHGKAKTVFLLHFREGWSVRFCSDKAKVERTTIWRWRQADQTFDKLYRSAREDGTDVFRDKAHEAARDGNVAAIALVLKMKGALPGDMNWAVGDEDTIVGAALTIEDLAQRAIERGYVSTPKALKEIDGADIVKVT